ncbi:CFI-box-CTERM domain-containing protein [Luxibacter massiliensis]|uniref:CFI-box-CTERM domain-containing protein n=1 Tax=Luxibacter massiliensis TaxID=2219695 RepID=UPI000F06A61F|nr:CFI-box-CTERM domain-containing protein [Luxibacter massiliensis]
MNQENLKAEMISLFEETSQYAMKFHKKTYDSQMESLKSKYGPLLEQFKDEFEESDERLEQLASYVPDYVAEQLAKIPSKRKRDIVCLDHNMNMVSYFIPLLGETQSLRARAFTEKIVELWNQKMPENKIGHSTRESIQGGFKKGLCYITTAVCRSLDKSDDCYELGLLRDYRDTYLLNSEEGAQTVQEYYNIAPTIVKRIDRREDAAQIYADIWREYLDPCVHLIEEEKREECGKLYREMVRRLEWEYLHSSTGHILD